MSESLSEALYARGPSRTETVLARWASSRPPTSVLKKILARRPVVSIEALAVLAGLYVTAASNGAFWRAASAAGALNGAGGGLTATSLFVAMAALNVLLLCLLLHRWTAKPVLVLLLCTNAAVSYFALNYGVYLDPAMVRSVLHTDAGESRELLTPVLLAHVLAFGGVPSLLVMRLQLRRYRWRRTVVRRAAVAIVAITLAAAALGLSFQSISALVRNHKPVRYLITPGNYLVSLGRVVLDDAGTPRGPRRPVGSDARSGHASFLKPHVLVIVVGETVRAQNWGLNGYRRQTTPQLARRNVINFRDVVACGSNTEVSVPCMFSPQGRRNYDESLIKRSESLLHVLERAGNPTLWRDNQTGCKGVCDGLAFESFRKPRGPDPSCDLEACRDQVMLRGLREAIQRSTGDLVVVLHQLGNHGPAYYRRYPDNLRRFRPDCRDADLGKCTQQQIVNAYDNAVLATDDFLARAIAVLESVATHDSALIYVSDHGESLGEGNLYLHGIPYPIAPDTQIRVPMVMWFSPGIAADRRLDEQCLRKRTALPASHDNLFHSVMGLLEVQTTAYDAGLDLFAGCVAAADRVAPGAGSSPDLDQRDISL